MKILVANLVGHGNVLAMTATIKTEYKRKLTRAAIDRMSLGGKRGTIEQKRKAGKAGWQALVRKLSQGDTKQPR